MTNRECLGKPIDWRPSVKEKRPEPSPKTEQDIRERWPLEMELLKFSPLDPLTLGDAVLSILILGGKGSGKTSGSMRAFRMPMLREGFGFLVLCCKPESADEFEELARECGRGHDVRRFRVDNGSAFNAIEYVGKLDCARMGVSEALSTLLCTLHEKISGKLLQSSEDNIWVLANRSLTKKVVFAQIQAFGRFDVGVTLRMIQSLPASFAQLDEPEQLESLRVLSEAEKNASPELERELGIVTRYFRDEVVNYSSRTRSSVQFTATSFFDCLLSSPLYELFFGSAETTLSPDDVLGGRIVIIDVPVEAYPPPIGDISAKIWKLLTQQAILRRNATFEGDTDELRPVCIDCDEAAAFISPEEDGPFLSTSRSSRGLMLMATQSLPSMFRAVGAAPKSKSAVQEILANAPIRVCHRSLCHETNQWFCSALGEVIRVLRSGGKNWSTNENTGSNTTHGTNTGEGKSRSLGAGLNRGRNRDANGRETGTNWHLSGNVGWTKNENRGQSFSHGTSISRGKSEGGGENWQEVMQLDLLPRQLVSLKTGGKRNQGEVEGIVIKGGEPFSNGELWMKCGFWQKGWTPRKERSMVDSSGDWRVAAIKLGFVVLMIWWVLVILGAIAQWIEEHMTQILIFFGSLAVIVVALACLVGFGRIKRSRMLQSMRENIKHFVGK